LVSYISLVGIVGFDRLGIKYKHFLLGKGTEARKINIDAGVA